MEGGLSDRITDALRGAQGTGPADLGMGTGSNQPGDEQGDGTAQAGYVTPDLGPFECSNCIHFDGQGACNHPQVISDPEVQGQVEPEGCCNFFKSTGQESQESEHPEGQQ